jgi:predicted regulator of Ras-like GTPase activity (Roadblock/LC7/MglB family)
MLDTIREPLNEICAAVPGAFAATIMGSDGVPVDTVEARVADGSLDVASLLVEYSALLGQVRSSAQMFAAGQLEELAISSENLTAIIRPLNTEFFVALALSPGANFGKGRYLLRLHAPRLLSALEN